MVRGLIKIHRSDQIRRAHQLLLVLPREIAQIDEIELPEFQDEPTL